MASEVKITFLGGLGEIGRNCATIEQDGQAVLIDCGLMFPTLDTPGVDLILPDFSYLRELGDRLVACVLTHGHEDHTGGLSYLLRELKFPIYGSEITLGLARNRIDEAGLTDNCSFEVVRDLEKRKVGPFEFEFIPVTHSVPHSFALAIRSAKGVIFHSGDFKIDLTPVDSRLMDLARIGEISKSEGIRLLLADSTNAEENGHSESESIVGDALMEVFEKHSSGRVIVGCFASHIHRIQQIANVAEAVDRKVFTLGRSMGKNVALARRLGILKIDDDRILDIEEVSKYPPEKVCVISTGSQGEPLSALTLMALGQNRWLEVGEGDLVVLSADAIPGNETAVGKVIDGLYRRGARVIHPANAKVHTSGHAKRDELRTLLAIAKPQYFVPVHGEYRHLYNHSRIAMEMGIDSDNVLLAQDGDSVILSDESLEFSDVVPAGFLYVDGVVGDVSHGVLRDRKVLSEEGVLVIFAAVDISNAEILVGPEIATKGFITTDESSIRLDEIIQRSREVLLKELASGNVDRESLAKAVRSAIGKLVSRQTKRKPMIIPVITEV